MKLKDWMIYLICVAVIPYPLAFVTIAMGGGTGEGVASDTGSALFEIAVIGGVILLIYRAVKGRKKKKKSENS